MVLFSFLVLVLDVLSFPEEKANGDAGVGIFHENMTCTASQAFGVIGFLASVCAAFVSSTLGLKAGCAAGKLALLVKAQVGL